MAYTIELSPRAFADIDAIVVHIQADSPANATRWRKRLFEKMDTLHLFPRGCALAPEDDFCLFEVRQTMLRTYRILFTVIESRSLVYVLSVRHASRQWMPGESLKQSASNAPGMGQCDDEAE